MPNTTTRKATTGVISQPGWWTRTLGQQQTHFAALLKQRGLVATPDGESLDVLASRLGKQGGVILVTEGTYRFTKTCNLTTSVHLIAESPMTIFETISTMSEPVITCTADRCVVSGITFRDAATSQPAIKVTGDKAVIRDCYFEDCYQAVKIDGSSWTSVVGNHVEASRDTDYAIYFTGTVTNGLIAQNKVQSNPTAEIRLDAAVQYTSIVGNITVGAPVGVISYSGHANEIDLSGNIGAEVSY